MKISVFVGSGATHPGVAGLVDTAQQAEAAGLDGVWYAQLFMEDALTAIALAGARTSRIELGTAVVPTFTRHPWVMAQQALTTQVATAGRLALGVGLSHRVTIEGNFGLRFDGLAKHAEEYLTVVRELTHSGSVNFDGEQYQVKGTMEVAGATPPSLLIAALGPRMLEVAGRLADGTITWMVGPRTLESHITPRIMDSAHRAGRPSPRICVGIPVAVADDREAALTEAASRFAGFEKLPSYRSMLDLEDASGPADVAAVGTESEVEEQLRTLRLSGGHGHTGNLLPRRTTGEVDRPDLEPAELPGRPDLDSGPQSR